ncbi:MAG TPA: DASS family sodium-coupled anion symporter [Alphaproteobacteria bacterium]|nr:DASS family sodium-coupled anion symporter [Alphaproteobacteria bacterium]
MSEGETPGGGPGNGEIRHRYQTIGLILGPIAAAILLFLPTPAGLSPEGWRLAAVALLMAIWWATEALPIPATAFIPVIAFPILGITSTDAAAAPYMDPVIFLLLGGFIIARSLERWNLHRRIALNILARVGSSPSKIIFGFMLATALLSMWVSNTATTAMMLPIGMSVIAVIGLEGKSGHDFAIALLLAIAYSASIGGLATLVGTPPNAMLAGFMRETYHEPIAFNRWLLIGIPVVLVMLPTAWLVLTRLVFRLPKGSVADAEHTIAAQLAELGPITRPEKRTAVLFGLVAIAWCLRPQIGALLGLKGLSDAGIAMTGALALFLIPSGDSAGRGRCLLDWQSAAKLNWGVILLFGGGLSLAAAVSATGLAAWLGQALSVLTTWPPILLAAAIATLIIFLTELTSNAATTAAILPILGAIATQGHIDPMVIAVPGVLAATCAFMLPVATPPNAMVFGAGFIHVPDMVKAGFRLNIAGIVIITLLSYFLVPLVFGTH